MRTGWQEVHDLGVDTEAQAGWAAPDLTPSPPPVCVTYDRRQTAADAAAAQKVLTVLDSPHTLTPNTGRTARR